MSISASRINIKLGDANGLYRYLGEVVGSFECTASLREIGLLHGNVCDAGCCCPHHSMHQLLVGIALFNTTIDMTNGYRQLIITMVPKTGEKFHFTLLNTVLR